MRTDSSLPPSGKMSAYRSRLRAQGLRPVQVWVPDVRLPKFRKEAKRQSLLVAKGKYESAVLDWLEDIADTEGWRE